MAYWEENDLDKAFEETKKLLMKAVELAHPDISAPIALTTDASKIAIGRVLEQYVNNQWELLGFWSKSLNTMLKWLCLGSKKMPKNSEGAMKTGS